MLARLVIDASVLGAAFFNEEHSDRARRFLRRRTGLIAPAFLHLEIASIAAKKVWRGLASEAAADQAVQALSDIVEDFSAVEPLARRALGFAIKSRFSVYDGIYLALAEAEGIKVATLDQKMVARAKGAGLGQLIHQLD